MSLSAYELCFLDVVFKFETESYDRDWSGQFGYAAQILEAEKEAELTDE